jgi:hypothetical protein
MKHYKYISNPDSVEYLLSGLLKVTPPAELNDPSELAPSVIEDKVLESLSRLRVGGFTDEDMTNLKCQEALLQRLAPQFQAIPAPRSKEAALIMIRSSYYNQVSILMYYLSETAKVISSRVGLFCTSRRRDSLPMWAHYAANAKGLVVEFNDLDAVFKGDNTNLLMKLLMVSYDRENVSVTFETNSHRALFFSKFSDWSYEQETRVVFPLDVCSKTKINEGVIYTYTIPKSYVNRLILGWNMLPKTKQRIRLMTSDINPNVEIVEAQIVNGRVLIVAPSRSRNQTPN